MRERFGPWSSALGDGLSPRLSTFWKRRLTRLEASRASRAGLTRRDWLTLGLAGGAAWALPTVRFAPAVAKGGPAQAGAIYVVATLKTGPGAADTISGVIAINPENGEWSKVKDFGDTVRVSPDGRTLALSRSGRTGVDGREVENVGVWTLDAAGQGALRRVSNFGGVMSWSPDGKQLSVAKWLSKPGDEESRSENWRINADGSGATRLPLPETEEVDDWSPDGRWLVTTSDRHPPHGRGYQLYLMRPDGTGQRRLTEGGGLNVYPRFSPDGRRIAYLHQERGQNSLRIVDTDGGNRRLLVREENDASPGHFCWSPDGKSLAYTLEDWQRDAQGKKFIDDPAKADRRIAILDLESGKSRPLHLPSAHWIGAPDWR